MQKLKASNCIDGNDKMEWTQKIILLYALIRTENVNPNAVS